MSIHLACYNEPPEMVIATIDSLARLDYPNFEVLVIDNNTTRRGAVEAARGALRQARRALPLLPPAPTGRASRPARSTSACKADRPARRGGRRGRRRLRGRARLAAPPDRRTSTNPNVAVVQAPQAHRDWDGDPFKAHVQLGIRRLLPHRHAPPQRAQRASSSTAP